MPTVKDMKAALTKWANLLNNPEIAEHFAGFNKTMQFEFPDINAKIQLIIKDKKATVKEGFNPNAEMSLSTKSELFLGIADGSVDPMEAFMNGDLQPKGDMTDLEKLQVFMEAK
jgi:putative sterol carrier protein